MTIQDLQISSPDFAAGGRLEDRFANDQGNEQPALLISGVPEGAVELAIICHDPDAPMPDGFTHWLLYGLPADTTWIGHNEGDTQFRPGTNDFGTEGYGGPQPPAGHGPHHYYFWVYALDTPVDGAPSRREFLDGHGRHVLEQNRIVGIYEN